MPVTVIARLEVTSRAHDRDFKFQLHDAELELEGMTDRYDIRAINVRFGHAALHSVRPPPLASPLSAKFYRRSLRKATGSKPLITFFSNLKLEYS
jgi:hypothetical protein